jgi:hypothetical protein
MRDQREERNDTGAVVLGLFALLLPDLGRSEEFQAVHNLRKIARILPCICSPLSLNAVYRRAALPLRPEQLPRKR